MQNDLRHTPSLNLDRPRAALSYLATAILLAQLMLVPAVSVAQETPTEKLSLKQRFSQKVSNLQAAFQNTPPDNTISLSRLTLSQPEPYEAMMGETGIVHESSDLPTIEVQARADISHADSTSLDLIRAIQIAVNRHPAIAQTLAQLSSEYSQVDVAKAGYWPQVQAGVSTGRMGTSEAGRQLLSVNATQMLYDFGKVSSNVEAAQASVDQQKAVVLKQIDAIALQTAEAIVNVRRYQELKKIAEQQVSGVARILEITRLRARAGISSQADPVQAQARYEGA